MRRWQCRFCGYIYDESQGDPERGIPSDTKMEDLPDDWICLNCGESKESFDLLEGK